MSKLSPSNHNNSVILKRFSNHTLLITCITALALQTQAADVWQIMRKNFKIDNPIQHPMIQEHIRWYQKNPNAIANLHSYTRWYLPSILKQVLDAKLPAELALLPLVESNYNPFAHSHRGASGLWQIMPSLATSYQLQINHWQDQRRDPLLATQTALHHLKHHYNILHNWEHSITAYNAGIGRVIRHRNYHLRKQKKIPPLWQLLPAKESQEYMPKLLALQAIIKNPSRYNIKLPNLEYRQQHTAIVLNRPYAFSDIAKRCNIPMSTLRLLNPSWRRLNTVTLTPSYPFYLPSEHANSCAKQLRQHNPKNSPWAHHRVVRQQTLQHIAKKYHSSIDSIKALNPINNSISPGQTLLIYPNHSSLPKIDNNILRTAWITADSLPGPRKIIHQVKSRQNIQQIAKIYGTTAAKIRYWNKLKTNHIPQNQLVIWQNQSQQRKYTIKKDDCLANIAKKFRTTTKKIVQANHLISTIIHPGKQLIIPNS